MIKLYYFCQTGRLRSSLQENILFCAEHYSKTIVVLNIGSSFDTSFMDEISGINALIYLCQLVSADGEAFADIITGRITPSGKLSDTWVKSYNDVPCGENYSFLNGNLENEDYLEDIYVGYHYYDTFHVEPRYPFGYGLRYTTFSIEYQSASMKNDTLTVNAQVCNTGTTYSGKEIVQLYASCPAGKLEKEYQRLVAFTKTGILPPGESENVELSFPLSSLKSSSLIKNSRKGKHISVLPFRLHIYQQKNFHKHFCLWKSS